MNIKETQKQVHENAVDKGFWEPEPTFGDLIALCHSELSEALEEYRNKRMPYELYYSYIPDGKCVKCPYFESEDKTSTYCCECTNGDVLILNGKPEGIPAELADVVIRIMDMCEHYGIDLASAILEKHEFNKTRAYRHGGKVI